MRSWKLGTAFGIGVFVHWTFLLLLSFVLYTNWEKGGLELALYAGTLLVSLFGCVVLHELGHALMARRFGIPTRDITLYPIGGVARLERMSERPWEEFWIAIAGPAVNVAIAAFLSLFLFLPIGSQAATWPSAPLHGDMVFDLWVLNLVLVAFNLLPAFPMDGGRVLRALLIGPLGRLRATEVAATLGTVFAVIFAIAGILGPQPMLLLIAVFAYFAGQQELAAVRQREYYRRSEVLDVLPADPGAVDYGTVPSVVPFSGTVWDGRARAWVVWFNGRPVQVFRVE